MSRVIDIGCEKQLFIDERWFGSQTGMRLCVNPPTKHERVLLPERPWESTGVLAFNTVLEHEGTFHLWYDTIGPVKEGKHARGLCHATSDDGINWRRTEVDLFEWEGIRRNNIVMPGAEGVGVMVDPNGPAEHRFKALAIINGNDVWPESRGCICQFDSSGIWMELYLCTSPDGTLWRKIGPALPFFHDTQNQFLYDDRLGRYVAYVRAKEVKPIRAVGRIEFDDPMGLPWPHKAKPNAPHGPGITRGSSRNAEIPIVLCTDGDDPGECDFYNPCVVKYPWAPDAYFSFPSFYRHYAEPSGQDDDGSGDPRGRRPNDGPLEVQLATSRDGIKWVRPGRRPYVPLGPEGDWDAGQVYMTIGMIRRDAEIWQYYSGTPHTHGTAEEDMTRPYGGVGMLVQRLDGFVSADADYTGGDFTTPPVTFSGQRLELNVDCSAMGEVWVEIRDEENRPIPGYGLDDCISVDRNHIAAPVRWKNREAAGELAGRPVRLHFRCRACKLYAFQFV